ncbi:MAG: hypothetical protein U9Q08_01510 [Candidatus Omnitrophota bacterium]|nr:hypothetical protein [Candidatus Omnitrophota bacterium]
MDKRTTKTILLVMVLVCALSVIVAAKSFFLEQATYQRYLETKQTLTGENLRLTAKIEESGRAISKFKLKLQETAERFEQANRQYSELEQRHKMLVSEKDKLNTELTNLAKEKMALEGKTERMKSDLFFGRVLKERASLRLQVTRLEQKFCQQELETKKLTAEKADLKADLRTVVGERRETEEKAEEMLEVSDILGQELAREKKNRLKVVEKLDREKAENKYLQNRMNDLTRQNAGLERRLTLTDNRLAKKEADKSRLADKIAELNSSLKEKLDEIEGLRLVLGSLENRVAILDDKLKQNKAANVRLTKKSAGVDVSENIVELSPIIIKAALSSGSAESESADSTGVEANFPQGRVLTVNKEYEFVVIDLGQKDGVEAGMPMTVYRSGREIGKLEILEVHSRISAADIKPVSGRKKKKDIRIDDVVVLDAGR